MGLFEDFKARKKLEEKNKSECVGLFYRATRSSWFNGVDTFGSKATLKLLKKMSCPGCEKCAWFHEFMHEEILHDDEHTLLKDLEDGAVYTYKVRTTTEWETGFTEIDYIEFIKVPEKGNIRPWKR